MADGPQPAGLQRAAGRDPWRPANPPRGLLTAPPIRQPDRRRPLHARDRPPPHRGALPAPAVGAIRPSRGSLLRRRQRLHRGAPAPPAGGVPRAALRTRPVAAGGLPHPGQGVRPVPVVRPDDAAHLSSTPCTFGERSRQASLPGPALPNLGRPRHPRRQRPRRRSAALHQRQPSPTPPGPPEARAATAGRWTPGTQRTTMRSCATTCTSA